MKGSIYKLLLGLQLALFSPLLHAETLLLVHGYLGTAASWQTGG